ncbi:hypothetical protein [Sulfurovum sp. NBC37-1]|uniref:hypothetical protein n=1 Tax=Sulfurovum sp. (strain NBC37-1) TaxID=387093 RepID=UPI0001587B07|nr:hypothetical protein [Sulfurovum sp. NBC37-1]BAF73351.1 hypothetical protein SUN_2415 [Sulfurovum sp. NBC37-1]
MTIEQHELYEKRTKEMETIANIIEALPINEQWIKLFTAMAYYRGWRKLPEHKQEKLINIAEQNSPSVATIVEQRHTKLSLDKIERIATVVTDEADRAKIRDYLLNLSWENAKKSINLIIASYEDQAA